MLGKMMAHLGLNASAAPSSLPPAAPSSLPPAASFGSGSKRQRTGSNDADADADANMSDTTTTRDANASNNSAADIVTAVAGSSRPRNFLQSISKAVPGIKYGSKAKADTNPSDKGITLSSALVQMFERSLLCTDIALTEFGKGRSSPKVSFISSPNQEKMNKCLVLVNMVWTDAQQEVLRAKPKKSDPTQDASVARVTKEIQDAVMTKMAALEKDAFDAGAKQIRSAGKRAQPKVMGIGNRYQKYLQAIKELENQSE